MNPETQRTSPAMPCPRCQTPMGIKSCGQGRQYLICPQCEGRLISVAVLRGIVDPEHVSWIWSMGREGVGEQKRPCPRCRRLMYEVPSAPEEDAPKLDVCRYCTLVWFDAGEFDRVDFLPKLSDEGRRTLREMNASIAQYGQPGAAPRSRFARLDPMTEAKERLAVAKIKEIKRVADERSNYPDEWWKVGLAIIGVPVKLSGKESMRFPFITWILTFAVCAISIYSFSNLEEVVDRFAFVPRRMFRYYGLTLVSAFFLHGGWGHLLGNMYFFLTFGDNVEDYLGRFRFLLLLILSTVAGNLLHGYFEPRSGIPCLGASGGISGVIAFFMLKFPRVKLGFYFWLFLYPKWIKMSAITFFVFWILFQFRGLALQISGLGSVSALAHFGGAAVGILFFLIYRKREPSG